MTVLLTGAGGFLGLNCLDALLARGVTCVAVNDRPLPDAYATAPGVIPEIADVRDRAAMVSLLARHRVDCILQAAAVTLAPSSRLVGADTAFDVNTVSTAILLDAARHNGVTRFVYPSSTAVYGAALFDTLPVTEDTAPRPASLYGYTKLASERLVRETALSFGLSCVIARITALFGPHERQTATRDMMSLPFQMAQMARAGTDVVLPGDLKRDWTSSRDAAEALVHLALAPTLPAQLYNISVGQTWAPTLLAQHLATIYPGWRHILGAPDGSDSALTFPEDPSRVRQPLVSKRFTSDFPFAFQTPVMACRDYTAWLDASRQPEVNTHGS